MGNKTLSSCYCKNIRRLSNSITKYYDDYLKNAGLTLNQYSLLSSTEKIQPASITQIAKKVGLERTTIVRDLKPLFKMELIEDIAEEGKRNRKIVLTKKGKDILNRAKPYWDEAQENIFNKLGEDKFDNFVDILNILADL